MGISTDLLIESQNIHQELQCSICQDVLEDPQMVEPCEHAFCGVCIEQWRADSNTCPVDRQQIRRLTRMQGPFLRMLNGLKMHCPFKERGCGKTVSLGDKQDHERRCEFNRRDCSKGCGAVLSPSQRDCHDCMAYLQEVLGDRKAEISNLTAELERMEAQLRMKDNMCSAQASQQLETKKELEAALEEVRDKAEALSRMKSQLAVKEGEVHSAMGSIRSLEDAVLCRDEELGCRNATEESLRAIIMSKDSMMDGMTAELKATCFEVNQANDLCQQSVDELNRKDLELQFRNEQLTELLQREHAMEDEAEHYKSQLSQSQRALDAGKEEIWQKEEELKRTLDKLRDVTEEYEKFKMDGNVIMPLPVSTSAQRAPIGNGATGSVPRGVGGREPDAEEDGLLNNSAEVSCVKNMQDSLEFVEEVRTVLHTFFFEEQKQLAGPEPELPAELSRKICSRLKNTRHLLAWRVKVVKVESKTGRCIDVDRDQNEFVNNLSTSSILLFRVFNDLCVSIAY